MKPTALVRMSASVPIIGTGCSFGLDSAFYVGSGAVVYATFFDRLWRHKSVNITQ